MIIVSIIIPTYNRKEYLKSLLKQLFGQFENSDLNYNIVVVNDGSTDGTTEMLDEEFKKVQVVNGTGEWWYTKSINEGFKYAIKYFNPDYFLILNDDIVLSDSYLETLTRIIRNSDLKTIIGSIGITYKRPYKVINSGNQWRCRCLGLYKHYINFLTQVSIEDLKGCYDTLTLPGRGMLIPRQIVEDLRFFNEKFKQYHSDGDFTLRARKKGYEVKICWDLIVFVHLEKTSGSSSFINKSYLQLFKSFFNPVTRNYLIDKIRFSWAHNSLPCSFIQVVLFILISFRNVHKLKKYY